MESPLSAKIIAIVILIPCVCGPKLSWADDRSADNHGPHAGFVRDNELISVEVTPGAGKDLSIYIMDSHWEPITLKPSELQVSLSRSQDGKTVVNPLKCEAQKLEGFKCTLPKEATFKQGDQLNVRTTPETKMATTITFPYPFSSISERR